MLQKYLPKRYQVSEAFVIDSKGGISEKQNIVIYDHQYSPFLFNHADVLYIPAESVYAVLEVTQKLNASKIKYAAKKAKSVRALHRTSGVIAHAVSRHNKPRELFPIIGGLLTFESDRLPAFGESFMTDLKTLPTDERIDIGCSLKNGSFFTTCDENAETTVTIKDGEVTLLSFFLQLLAKLQALGTVPPIDISAYAAWID